MCDLADGCFVSQSGDSAVIVTQPVGMGLPRTGGLVDVKVIQELLEDRLVKLSATNPAHYKLTPVGNAYFERFLRERARKL